MVLEVLRFAIKKVRVQTKIAIHQTLFLPLEKRFETPLKKRTLNKQAFSFYPRNSLIYAN